MNQTDEFDILLILRSHGWSDFFLIVNHECFEYSISHVFSHPFVDIMKVVTDLINHQNETSFIWYGEPGGIKFEIQRIMTKQHKMVVSVYDFVEAYGYEPKYNTLIEFEIEIKQFVIIFYTQLKKTFMLLNDRQYAHNRDGHDLLNFHTFERSVIEFLKKEYPTPPTK